MGFISCLSVLNFQSLMNNKPNPAPNDAAAANATIDKPCAETAAALHAVTPAEK